MSLFRVEFFHGLRIGASQRTWSQAIITAPALSPSVDGVSCIEIVSWCVAGSAVAQGRIRGGEGETHPVAKAVADREAKILSGYGSDDGVCLREFDSLAAVSRYVRRRFRAATAESFSATSEYLGPLEVAHRQGSASVRRRAVDAFLASLPA